MRLTKTVAAGAMATLAAVLLVIGIAAAGTKVVVIEGPRFFTGSPTAFAAQKGIFQKHGLDVEFVAIARATSALEALRNKQADLAWAGSAAVTRALKGSTDVKIIGQHMLRPFWILISQPEIKTIAQLKGKVLGASRHGQPEKVMVTQILAKNGVKEGEWKHQAMGVRQRWPALKNKQIAAVGLGPPTNMLAITMGFNRLADFDQHYPVWMAGTTVARTDTIKNKPEMIKSFLRSLKEAIGLLQGDREGAIQFWMKRYKVPRKAAAMTYDKYAPTFKLTADKEPVRKQWQFRIKQLKIKNPPPVESIVDFRLLQEVLKD